MRLPAMVPAVLEAISADPRAQLARGVSGLGFRGVPGGLGGVRGQNSWALNP